MTNENLKNLCLKLVAADTEDEVITILKDAGYWDNPYVWRYYGDQENNFATMKVLKHPNLWKKHWKNFME